MTTWTGLSQSARTGCVTNQPMRPSDYKKKKSWIGYLRVRFIKFRHAPIHWCEECNLGFLQTRGDEQKICVPCMNIERDVKEIKRSSIIAE